MLLVCIADACIGIPFQVSFDRSIWGCSPVSPVSQTQAAALLPHCGEVSGTTSMSRSLYAHIGSRDTCIASHLYAHQVIRDTCITSHLYTHKVSGATCISRSLYTQQVLRDTCMTSHLYKDNCLLTQTCHIVMITSLFHTGMRSEQSYAPPNLNMICFFSPKRTADIAKRVKLIAFRSFYYSHDFRVAVENSCSTYILHSLDEVRYKHAIFNGQIRSQLLGGAVLSKKGYMGRYSNVWSTTELSPYIENLNTDIENRCYRFVSYLPESMAYTWHDSQSDKVLVRLPIPVLVSKLAKSALLDIAHQHHLSGISQRKPRAYIMQEILSHCCMNCQTFISVFEPLIKSNLERNMMSSLKQREAKEKCGNISFPPRPVSSDLIEEVIDGFSKDISPNNFIESACAVCAQLVPQKLLSSISDEEYDENLLHNNDPITRCERLKLADPILDITGPILLPGCKDICQSCFLRSSETGRHPLAELFSPPNPYGNNHGNIWGYS